ncbi:uncharacterized protein [Primulina eburnea]|uniref:uncharacterized protein n=1 Tax=Primulina eburnea TaxID=1245227 RepID=UPI003C6C5A60
MWNDLIRFGANFSSPWILLGDFNNVLTPDEKQRGLKVKNCETKDFVDCVAILDLLDLKFSGCFYTWMSPKVCSKLDCVLVNQAWLSSNLIGHTEFQAPGCLSDHTVSIVSLLEDQKQEPKAFKFFNMWTLSDKFLDLVLDRWRFEGYGTCQYRLKQLFKGLKNHCRRSIDGNISSRAAAAKRRLEELQRNMLHTCTILDEYKQLKRKTEIVMEAERLFITQKTKINYLKQGDMCTKFFHDLIKRNNKRNVILAIKNSEANFVTDLKEIAQCFIHFYYDLLGKKLSTAPIDHDLFRQGPYVKEKDWNSFTKMIIVDEIDRALLDIGNDKAPGPDGFGALLTTFMGEIVDDAQTAFIKDRSIVDNIHLAQELLRKYARKRETPRCMLKVDLRKAYDIVYWDFLREFGDMAGLRINALKSNIYTASMADSVRQEILMITGFADGSLPFRYLGVPLAAARLKAADYSILVDTIARRINAWPRNSLSYAGKIELIRSMVQGVECFWLSMLHVPSCVIDSIQSIFRKFVWPTKHLPIAWTSVCKPLGDGGLGLKDLKAWNKALLAKTLWKIHLKKDSLWIK